ncbi:hypothetical protein [Synechococcus sp. CBW1107]|uniref:hypothetical protein n=1 Tax=Synechococcus sp. CBW1107 TaxID=2789857 RepID=UPI002AD59023|nr:hypothetical protein [Synechococcus sp. CBW1107]CAK6688857.1 hypothetical protein IFHNHDMJ_00492 [Synechococcus sp. CBW1107]
MTNLQEGYQPLSPHLRERLLMGLPLAVGGIVALMLFLALVLPQWLRLRGDEERVSSLAGLQQRIPLLQGQLRQLDLNDAKAQRQQRQVLSLIAGSGEITTFMAQVDQEAARHKVQLDVLEPVSATPEATKSTGGLEETKDGKKAPPPKPALESSGLEATRLLLNARGRYPDLLAFLRSLEGLSLLVVQSDLNLAPGTQNKPAGNTPTELLLAALQTPPTVMKLAVTLYSGGSSDGPRKAKPAAQTGEATRPARP